MIMQTDIIKNIEQLEKGMKLQFRSDFTGKIHQGIVSNIKYGVKVRFVDDKPVTVKTVEEVTVITSAIRSESIQITRKNFDCFRIRKVI